MFASMVILYSFLQMETLGRFRDVMFSYVTKKLRMIKVKEKRMKQEYSLKSKVLG